MVSPEQRAKISASLRQSDVADLFRGTGVVRAAWMDAARELVLLVVEERGVRHVPARDLLSVEGP